METANWKRTISCILGLSTLFTLTELNAQSVIYNKDNMHELPAYINRQSQLTEQKYQTKLLGSNYVSEEWESADVWLSRDDVEIQDVDVRLDVDNSVLEIRIEEGIKVIPSYKISKIFFKSTQDIYVSRSGLNLYGPTGFYRLLYEGNTALYCHYSTKVKESNYNVALDAGRMDDEIIHVNNYYLAKGEKLIKLENKKSKLADQLGGSELLEFIKENNIDVKKESGLIAIAAYLDEK